MGLIGKHPNKRARVKTSESAKIGIDETVKATASAQQSAVYIGEICRELRHMANAKDLFFLAYLLSMAQAEAENVGEIQSCSHVNLNT